MVDRIATIGKGKRKVVTYMVILDGEMEAKYPLYRRKDTRRETKHFTT